MALKIYEILFFYISAAYAQLELDGACNFTSLVGNNIINNFELLAFVGTWYQVERISNTFEQGDCSTMTITAIIGNDVDIEISNREIRNGKIYDRNGSITESSIRVNVPMLNVTYSDGNSYDLAILGTDAYYRTAVLYSCKTSGSKRSVWGWKYARNFTMSDAAKNATRDIVSANVDFANASWRTTSFTEQACKSSGGIFFPSPVSYLVILIGGAILAESLKTSPNIQ